MSALAEWMKLAEETDETLAAKVGVTRVQVTRLRNARNIPSRKTALELEKITGIPAATFIMEERRAG